MGRECQSASPGAGSDSTTTNPLQCPPFEKRLAGGDLLCPEKPGVQLSDYMRISLYILGASDVYLPIYGIFSKNPPCILKTRML